MTRDEARASGLKRYSPLKPCIHGHDVERYVGNNDCVACSAARALQYGQDNKEAAKARVAKWRIDKPEKVRDFSKAYYVSNAEGIKAKVKVWANDNPERVKENAQRTYRANPERTKAQARAWAKANPGKVRAALAYNRRRRNLAKVPLSAANKAAIIVIYETCPPGYDVDHIYPINGKNSCGLHVPWNLQHLPSTENREKSNKLPEGGRGYALEMAA